jgi:hypothetical protein
MKTMLRRELKLTYVLFEQPYAWRCTLCAKLFVSATSPMSPNDLEMVWKEFRNHNCWCALSAINLS